MMLGQFVERGRQTAIILNQSADESRLQLVLSDGTISEWQDAAGWTPTKMAALLSAWLVPFMIAAQNGQRSVCHPD